MQAFKEESSSVFFFFYQILLNFIYRVPSIAHLTSWLWLIIKIHTVCGHFMSDYDSICLFNMYKHDNMQKLTFFYVKREAKQLQLKLKTEQTSFLHVYCHLYEHEFIYVQDNWFIFTVFEMNKTLTGPLTKTMSDCEFILAQDVFCWAGGNIRFLV